MPRQRPGVRRWPLRMRVSISARGSLIVMACFPSPARLEHAGDQSGRGQLAHRDARHLELAVVAARPAGERAAVAHPRRRAVARQFGQLELRREAFLRRRVAVAASVFRRSRAGAFCRASLARRLFFSIELFFAIGSRYSAGDQFALRSVKVISKALSKALASSSVCAVVK